MAVHHTDSNDVNSKMTTWLDSRSLRNDIPFYHFSTVTYPDHILSISTRVCRKFNVQGSVYRKYIQIYIRQDATLHSLFISGNSSTCFRWYLHPSSGAHTTYLQHLAQVPDAVDTVVCSDDGWRYHPKHVEQFPEINKLCNVPSCCMYKVVQI